MRTAVDARIGFAGDDFTRSIVRYVAEERIALALERPQAICKITGLPTAAPTRAADSTTSGNK